MYKKGFGLIVIIMVIGIAILLFYGSRFLPSGTEEGVVGGESYIETNLNAVEKAKDTKDMLESRYK